jgi:hypothetical protein
MFEDENIDTQRVVLVGIFGALVAFILIVGVQVLFYRMEKADEYLKFVAVKPAERVAVQTEQLQQLRDYRWVDRTNGRAAIPIERAMDLELQTLQATASSR